MDKIREAVEFFGTQADMARALGVSAAAVNQWIKAGEIPAGRALQIEALSNGKIRGLELAFKAER